MPATLLLAAVLAIAPQGVTYQTTATKRPGFYSVSTKVPVIKGGSLASFANAKMKSIAADALASWMKEAAPDWKSKPRLEYFYEAVPTVSVATDEVISMYFTVSTFNAGAHGMTVYDPHTFALVDGSPQEVKAKDIFRGDYQNAVSSLVISKLMQNSRAEWVQNGDVKALTASQMDDFVVTRSGLTYLFNPYDMGPYAVGAFQVKVPFTELSGDLIPNGPLHSLVNR